MLKYKPDDRKILLQFAAHVRFDSVSPREITGTPNFVTVLGHSTGILRPPVVGSTMNGCICSGFATGKLRVPGIFEHSRFGSCLLRWRHSLRNGRTVRSDGAASSLNRDTFSGKGVVPFPPPMFLVIFGARLRLSELATRRLTSGDLAPRCAATWMCFFSSELVN